MAMLLSSLDRRYRPRAGMTKGTTGDIRAADSKLLGFTLLLLLIDIPLPHKCRPGRTAPRMHETAQMATGVGQCRAFTKLHK